MWLLLFTQMHNLLQNVMYTANKTAKAGPNSSVRITWYFDSCWSPRCSFAETQTSATPGPTEVHFQGPNPDSSLQNVQLSTYVSESLTKAVLKRPA